MRLKLLMTLFVVTSFFSSSYADAKLAMLSITGSTTACTGEAYSYSVVNDPTVYYEWTITNGTFITSPIGSNQVDVAWYGSGTITVSTYSDPGLTILVGTTSLSVTVDVLSPYITMDPQVGCLDENGEQESAPDPHKKEDECTKACEDNLIKYFSNGNPGSTFTWQVIGDAFVSLNTSSQLNVTWQSVGFGIVKLTETSVNGCVEETEICVEIIAKPKADFNVIPGFTVCLGQTVYFEDLSMAIGDSDLTAWEWKVSDGTFQSYTESTDFSHIFNSPGTFTVTLRVYNDCGCYDDHDVTIDVLSDPGPEIFCPKVVCPNEKTEIYTNSGCGVYNWSVVNGTIVSGLGTPNITVMWNDDPSGVGYVYLSTPCGGCPVPSVLEIPIVSTSLDIDGPIEACVGDQVTLTAPLIPGTFYNWNVYSTPTSAFIVQQIHNQVIISVTGAAPITVEVIYNNELAGCGDGCGGEATHTLIAVDPSFVVGDEDVCVGDSKPYTIAGPATGNITVELPNGSTTTTGNGSNFNFTSEGTYVFTPSNAGCQGPPLIVTAHPIPPAPDVITGPTEVCPGMPYEYEAGNDVDGTIYAWTVSNGTPATGVGKEITVTWNLTGPYLLKVRRINIQPPNCEGPSDSLSVDPITISPNLSGPSTVCANQSYSYSLDYLDGEEYKWAIDAESQGSVITDPNNSSVDILWNNTTGTAIVTGSVRKCNLWFDVSDTITINPVNNVSFTADQTLICQNETVVFTADPGYSNYDWSFDPAFTSPPGNVQSFSQTFTQAGTFIVTLVATDNCGNISVDSEVITVLPEPPAVLSITGNTLACPPVGPVTGSATLVTTIIGGVAGHTFSWKKDGSSVPGTSSTLLITDTGTYEVTVTNTATGCKKVLTIKVKCPSGPGCSMPAGNTGTFDFTYDNITCGEVTFNETSISTAAGWTFLGGTFVHNGVNAFSAPGPTFTYSSFNDAGYYDVGYEICFSSGSGACCRTIVESVPIPVVAEAEAVAFCDGSGNYMIQLDDFSSSLGNLSGYDYQWFIDGTMVGSGINATSATSTVPLGALVPGNTYTVRLEVFVPMSYLSGLPSDYGCEFTTSVVIPALPDATFTDNTPICEDLDVEFTAALNSPNSTYFWNFGDGATLIQTTNTAARKYDGPNGAPGYNVTLTVTNAAGCTDTQSNYVDVESNDFGAPTVTVTPTAPICKPNPASLNFTHSGTATASIFAWSDGATVNPNVVFDAGAYTVTATDAFGCTSVSNLTPVDIRPSPNAFILGEGDYCWQDGLPVRLFGYAGPGLTYQWRKKPNGGSWFVISSSDEISDSSVNPWQSPYMYELTVTDPATGCSAVTVKTIEVHSPPPAPSITETLLNCDPFVVNLTATATISPAYFNWSNGTTGASNDVMYGGKFEVTLTDDKGCTSTSVIDVEGPPNFDFFPAGCYEYCREDMPLFYPGPYGNFDSWDLYLDNGSSVMIVQSGAGPITNLAVTDEGKYWLEVIVNGCTYTSDIMHVVFNEEKCEMFCKEECYVKVTNITPNQIQDCLYEFTADVFLGECTDIIDYKWTVNGSPVPGGAVMSYVFPNAGGGYSICLTVVGEDDYGNTCDDTYCIDFSPTCKCSCDVTADFEIIQLSQCEYTFQSTSITSECTEIYKYVWSVAIGGNVIFDTNGSKFSYGFESTKPAEICLYIYGTDGKTKCKDKICKTIQPCVESIKDDSDSSASRDKELSDIQVSPNPTTDVLRIEGVGPIGNEWRILVVDISGRVVANSTVQVDSPQLNMSTEAWKAGMYQVIVSDELGNRFIRKVIKVE
ncbi:MAG: PKD domain-containing protein [Bacteroidota bacterium]